MASKNLFAPPSKEELKMASQSLFAPPTEDEIREVPAQSSLQEDLSAFAEKQKLEAEKPMKALGLLSGRGLTLGGSALAAGAGGGLGAAYGSFERGAPLKEILSSGKEGFLEARKERLAQEAEAEKEYPNLALATDVGGAIATAPLAPLRTAKQVLGTGLGLGLIKAGRQSESASDIPMDVAQGVAETFVGKKIGDVAGKAIQKAPGLLQKAKPYVEKAMDNRIGKTIKSTTQGIAKIPQKALSSLTGMAEKDINTYWNKTEKINKAIEKYGEDASQFADDIRKEFGSEVTRFRRSLSGQITEALKKEGDIVLEPTPVIEHLQKARTQLNPKFEQEAIAHIDDMIEKVAQADNVGDMFAAKEYLQDIAKGQYARSGQIFTVNNKAARAAKLAASEARKIVNYVSPEIAKANNQLARLHQIEDRLTRTVLKEGAPEASLIAAGRGANTRNERLIKELSDLTGYDLGGRASELSAQKAFSNVKFDPVDVTGKSAARLLLGAGAGGAMGGIPGAAIGSALTSPLAAKMLINASQVPRKSAKKTGGLIRSGAKGFLDAGYTGRAGGLLVPRLRGDE